MTVADLMTQHVVFVNMDDPIRVIQYKLEHGSFHHLLVVEEGRLMGVISDRDVLKAVSPFLGTLSERTRDAHTLQKRAHQIMSHRPVHIQPDAEVGEAVALLLKHDISCLPVCRENGLVEGIITWRDLLQYYAENR